MTPQAAAVPGQRAEPACYNEQVDGDPTDINESTKIEWFTLDEIRRLLRNGEITDGLSFGGLTFALATGVL